MSAPSPFIAWGMDMIGSIEPKASNGHKFILVAIDCFTKWVEAVITTDNATNLNCHLMQEVCYQFKIEHRNSTTYRPKAKGVVEAANKNINKILRKMVQSSRQRHEKSPFALLGYRTTVRTSVGATPYSLLYGNEEVLPA
ncbi:uncharacterized protein LOC107030293 [Solanum pennellii]|uniref:Uncharacterized protein LOC107030293 n=1 Tax=Solanum pennellii TaxID=28526 RepID=A0ABM1HL60_SOLPN|nr:uncharacterized protein LOC107030293 [Solanum pennellii]